ncbi:hypothetical protein [Macropodid alphaherpesvirus 1]|uniref:Uncharacterized protein n=1 Tax=Macropodid alphaherpesvirus 1 TaxID=137443 RepID=A0A0Y0A897_9ALPH|nr:hypothetical protein [Macropodid alphaherpesvirus 1]AMB17053.1 hypothetical protein [Macropodid alphaherpesvirus 1]
MSQINDQGYAIIDLRSPGSVHPIISPHRPHAMVHLGLQRARSSKDKRGASNRSSVSYKAVSDGFRSDVESQGSPRKHIAASKKKLGPSPQPIPWTPTPLPMYPTTSPGLFPPRTSNHPTNFSPPQYFLQSSNTLQVPPPPIGPASQNSRGSISSIILSPSRAAVSPRPPGQPRTRREIRIKARNYMFLGTFVIVILLLVLLYYLDRHWF